MAILQKEKLVVIKKEFLHLQHIADFYRGDNTQREQIAQSVYGDIGRYIDVIKELNSNINQNIKSHGDGENSYLQFLTLYDHYNEDIKELLKIVKLIQSKFLQFQHEHFNQYMPVPNINKRYSTKGFLDYLKIYHTKVLEKEGFTVDLHPITLWGHQDTFYVHNGRDIPGGNHGDRERYLEIPFWHYEIPFMLPFITHEIGHVVLENKPKNSCSSLHKLKELFMNDGDLAKLLKKDGGIVDEIFSDMFAMLHHGEAFIIAQAHELLGKGFSEQFYSHNKEAPATINTLDSSKLHFIEALIRLLFMVNFYKSIAETESKKTEKEQAIDEIENILHWLIVQTNQNTNQSHKDHDQALIQQMQHNPSGLAKIYFLHGSLRTYIDFHYSVTAIPEEMIKIFEKKRHNAEQHLASIMPKNDGQNPTLTNYKETYNEMIDLRLDQLNINSDNLETCKISSKNIFRKLLLEKDSALPVGGRDNNIGSPYELTFFKTRTDSFANVANYFQELKKQIQKHHSSTFFVNSNISPVFAFDYFSAIVIGKKKEVLGMSDLDDFLDPNEKTEKDEQVVKFYSIKHSLILVAQKGKGTSNKDGKFSIFVGLALDQNNSEETIKAKQYIEEIIDSTNNISAYRIFKSLGPKEILLHIENISLETIFAIKKRIFSDTNGKKHNNPFHRSYTVIGIDYANIKDVEQAGNNLHFGSYIRGRINQRLPQNTNIGAKLIRTGVLDYMIQWKSNTKLSAILKYYNELVGDKGKAKCTDIQTFIAKKEPSGESQND